MGYAMIGTWQMALAGVRLARPVLAGGAPVAQAVETAICAIEDDPGFVSVGLGGLPNRHCEVELDAAYMDGDSLRFGGVMGVQNIKNPIKVARHLSKHYRNCLLSGKGAEMYAQQHGFAFANMLTESSVKRWAEKAMDADNAEDLTAYAGHDTVCMIGLDADSHMGVGVSTSGLFMKHPGRVGDSPIIGSGFYCDSKIGGAAATGVGEDIMKGCLSYEIVRSIKEGLSPQEACDRTLFAHLDELSRRDYKQDLIAVIAMDKNGRIGASSTLETFAFAYAGQDDEASIYMAVRTAGKTSVGPATREQLEQYLHD